MTRGGLSDPLRNRGWQIDVRPSGNGEVTITLPTSQETCNSNSVPCTSDGRRLSAPASVTVRGPVPWVTGSTSFTAAENQTAVAALTASDIKTPIGPFTWVDSGGRRGRGGRRQVSGSDPTPGCCCSRRRRTSRTPTTPIPTAIYEVHGPGPRRRQPDGHGGPDGDADERQRGAHRQCGPRTSSLSNRARP